MSVKYVTIAEQLPRSKMRRFPTKVINIIGGPGSEKSLFSAAIVLYMHLHHHSVEVVPDFAKSLVWQQDLEALKNQYGIAQRQYEMINLLDGQVEFIVTEGSLPQLLFYNEHYDNNICDVAKTRQQILSWYAQHDNVNIMVKRGERPYSHIGRSQSEEEAKAIDNGLRNELSALGIPYALLEPNVQAIHKFTGALLQTPVDPIP